MGFLGSFISGGYHTLPRSSEDELSLDEVELEPELEVELPLELVEVPEATRGT